MQIPGIVYIARVTGRGSVGILSDKMIRGAKMSPLNVLHFVPPLFVYTRSAKMDPKLLKKGDTSLTLK